MREVPLFLVFSPQLNTHLLSTRLQSSGVGSGRSLRILKLGPRDPQFTFKQTDSVDRHNNQIQGGLSLKNLSC